MLSLITRQKVRRTRFNSSEQKVHGFLVLAIVIVCAYTFFQALIEGLH